MLCFFITFCLIIVGVAVIGYHIIISRPSPSHAADRNALDVGALERKHQAQISQSAIAIICDAKQLSTVKSLFVMNGEGYATQTSLPMQTTETSSVNLDTTKLVTLDNARGEAFRIGLEDASVRNCGFLIEKEGQLYQPTMMTGVRESQVKHVNEHSTSDVRGYFADLAAKITVSYLEGGGFRVTLTGSDTTLTRKCTAGLAFGTWVKLLGDECAVIPYSELIIDGEKLMLQWFTTVHSVEQKIVQRLSMRQHYISVILEDIPRDYQLTVKNISIQADQKVLTIHCFHFATNKQNYKRKLPEASCVLGDSNTDRVSFCFDIVHLITKEQTTSCYSATLSKEIHVQVPVINQKYHFCLIDTTNESMISFEVKNGKVSETGKVEICLSNKNGRSWICVNAENVEWPMKVHVVGDVAGLEHIIDKEDENFECSS